MLYRFVSRGQVTPVMIDTYLDPRLRKMYISPDDLPQTESKTERDMELPLLAAQSVSVDASTMPVPVIQTQGYQASFLGSHDEVLVVEVRQAFPA